MAISSEQSWCVPTRLSLYTISSSLLTSFLLSCARRFHAPLAYDGHENKGQDEARHLFGSYIAAAHARLDEEV
jgi:hypothetical protein